MKFFPAIKSCLLNTNFVLGYPSFSCFSSTLTENNIPHRNDYFKIHQTKESLTGLYFPFVFTQKCLGKLKVR